MQENYELEIEMAKGLMISYINSYTFEEVQLGVNDNFLTVEEELMKWIDEVESMI